MTEKTPENDRKTISISRSYLKIAIPGAFWLGMVVILAFLYGDSFWLWVTRAFDLSFILYTVAVIYGLYIYIPKFGAVLAQSFMGGIGQFFLRDKMSGLSQKGVEARAAKAEQEAGLALVASVDPLKAVVSELVSGFLDNMDSIPKSIRPAISAQIGKAIGSSNVNFTTSILGAIDKKFPQLKLSENLKALGVISNAEKVA